MAQVREWYLGKSRDEYELVDLVDGKPVIKKPYIRICGEGEGWYLHDERVERIDVQKEQAVFLLTTMEGFRYELRYEEAYVYCLGDTAAYLLKFGVPEEEVGRCILMSRELKERQEKVVEERGERIAAEAREEAVSLLSCKELYWRISETGEASSYGSRWEYYYKNGQGEVKIPPKYVPLHAGFSLDGVYDTDDNMSFAFDESSYGNADGWHTTIYARWSVTGLQRIWIKNICDNDIVFQWKDEDKYDYENEEKIICKSGEITSILVGSQSNEEMKHLK